MSDSYDFDFNREDDGMVWVRVDAGYGLMLTLRSDEPSGCRDWTADEVEIAFDQRVESLSLRREVLVPYESDLGRALSKAFDKFVSTEARFLAARYGR